MSTAVPAQFYNDTTRCVPEFVATLLRTTPSLQQLGDLNVVVRRDIDKSKVSLICGGGSGHEPAHAGFVGKGMLSGAVAGNVFASPPTSVILQLIRYVTGPKGCLVIVKNYTGDCLNFGLAVERARQEGLQVEIVVVADDVTLLDTDTLAGPRGLCGVLFVQKIAGAMAELGGSLEEVTKVARDVLRRIGTAAVSLSPCSPPGKPPSFTLPIRTMEFGVGIHGEAGVLRSSAVPCSDCVDNLFSYLSDRRGLGLTRTDDVAVIVNNLGGTSQLEMGVICNDVIKYLTLQGMRCHRLYSGTFVTSLNMHGVSISVLRINRDLALLKLLKEPTVTSAWKEGIDLTIPSLDSVINVDKKEESRIPMEIRGKAAGKRIVVKMLLAVCEDLKRQVTLLDELDRVTGDGDCGSTIDQLVTELKPKVAYLDLFHNLSDLLLQVAEITELHMGGTLGALYTIGLTAAARVSDVHISAINIEVITNALDSAIQAISFHGKAKEGDCTMLDVLYPVLRALTLNSTAEMSALSALLIKSCDTGVLQTKSLVPRAGRSSYIGSQDTKTTEDPGAVVAATWIKAICKVLYAGSI